MCQLCGYIPFKITFCNSHPDQVLVVSSEHKPEFSKDEKEQIVRMFPNGKIRWDMRSIQDHAHCHAEVQSTARSQGK